MRKFRGPLLKDALVRLDEMLLRELTLLDGQLAALHPVIDDLRQRVIVVLQARLINLACHRVGVVYLRAVDALEGFHRADGADQFEIGVIAQQVTKEIEGQRRNTVRRHEEAHLHPHLREVLVGRRQLALLVLNAQDGMVVGGAPIGLAGRDAEADDRRLAEAFLVSARVDKVLEQLSVQHTEVVRDAELRPVGVVLGQHDAEVVIAHVGREIVAHDAVDAPVQFLVDDVGLEDLDQRKHGAALDANVYLNGDDLEFDRVAISGRVVPMREVIETVVDHLQRSAQVLLPALSTRQVGEIGGEAGAVRRQIVLIETDALEAIGKVFAHDDLLY